MALQWVISSNFKSIFAQRNCPEIRHKERVRELDLSLIWPEGSDESSQKNIALKYTLLPFWIVLITIFNIKLLHPFMLIMISNKKS